MRLQRLAPRIGNLNSQRLSNTVTAEVPRMRGRKLQERRLRLWAKDPCCATCGILTSLDGKSATPFQLDHKVPLFKGGDDIDDNCQVLCIDCHDLKTAGDLDRRENRTVWGHRRPGG